jgi:alanine-glyoxylate transaminase/serine-glyoxylate transaminase/serine-pyruvate transaminase
MGYWEGAGSRAYHHTAPVNALYGLHESLVMLAEEGLEARWARHATQHRALAAGLAVLELGFVVGEAHRLPQLNSIWVPHGVDEAALRRCLLEEHGIEIGAGLGALAGKVWRIGLMGSSCVERNVVAVLTALGVLLGRDAKGAVDAARSVWSA